jgi:UDP-N-acetylmuramoylalanine--D-glutamate ligase
MKIDFKNKKIAVIGLGIEGESSVKYLEDKGAEVFSLDLKQGSDYLNDLNKYDILVRSPGIKLSILEKVISKEKITSQTKLFFDLCPGKIIGVTGTKGKGTTSSLIYEMLKKQGKDAYLVGNIGSPALDVLSKLDDQSIVVYELSSFQLQDLEKSPHIAVMLMTTSEHLAPDKKDLPDQNYHEDLVDYINAKRNILRFQSKEDFAILNKDYPACNESDICTDAKIFKVSREQEVLEDGAFIKEGFVCLRKDEKEEKIINIEDILLPGAHNLENICAAIIAASICGVLRENIVSVLKTFKGLPHRLELVDTIHGVKYYDDSFSTTPETAIAAIHAFKDPEILILGGASKNSDFFELGKIISEAENIKAIIGIGIEWEKIKAHIAYSKSQTVFIEGAKDMKTIVKAAAKIAETGDVVILSPACSSFDMFKNYKDRGDQFKKQVKNLRLELN